MLEIFISIIESQIYPEQVDVRHSKAQHQSVVREPSLTLPSAAAILSGHRAFSVAFWRNLFLNEEQTSLLSFFFLATESKRYYISTCETSVWFIIQSKRGVFYLPFLLANVDELCNVRLCKGKNLAS